MIWVYAAGLLLLALTMIGDLYLSFIPHAVLAVGAVGHWGWSWQAGAAVIIPHLLFFALRAARLAVSGREPPTAQ